MIIQNHFKKTLLATSVAFALSACGGAGSGSSSNSFSGTVADGYLKDAKVCLDLNDNKTCDAGEPTTTSTDGGKFTLNDVSPDQTSLHALVVEVVAGVTEDEDQPGLAIDKAYSMTAPAGYDFVSPLTTLVQQKMDENANNKAFKLEDAEAEVKTKLGTDLDLREDYVEAKGADSHFNEKEKKEFEKLHKVAQVTARVMKENLDTIKTVVENSNIDFEQVLDMVVGKVLDALDTIHDEVEKSDLAGNFDPDDVAANGKINKETGVDETTFEDDIAARQADKLASGANLVDLVSTVGINWFNANDRENELELAYGSFQYDATTNESTESQYVYDPTTHNFLLEDKQPRDDREFLLSSNGWIPATGKESISVNDNGSITVVNAALPAYTEQLDAKQFDIAGLNISATLDHAGFGGPWAEVVDPTTQFSVGALGFKLQFTTLNDQYRMWNGDCDDNEIVGGMCNSVWENTGDGKWETDGPATTLDSLVSDAASNATDPSNIRGVQVAWFHNTSIYAEMLKDGQVNFYRVEYRLNGPGTAEIVGKGVWEDRLVDGTKLRAMELPTGILREGNFDYSERFIFLAEKDGFVRRGDIKPAGSVRDENVVFNQEAKGEIISAFDETRFNALSTEIARNFEQEKLDRQDDKFIEHEGDDVAGGSQTGTIQTPVAGTVTNSAI